MSDRHDHLPSDFKLNHRKFFPRGDLGIKKGRGVS